MMRRPFLFSLILLARNVAAYSSPRRAHAAAAPAPGIWQVQPSDRRGAMSQIAALVTTLAVPSKPAHSAVEAPNRLAQDILESRSAENSLTVPPYGMESNDIFYPPNFRGSWKVYSKTADIVAPCGYELFTGGKTGYDNAVQSEIRDDGKGDLYYKARFVTLSGGEEGGGGSYIAADREYNAREIAKAAMGAYSIIDTPVANPNRYSCLLAPPDGSNTGDLISVDILTLARKFERQSSSPDKFACSEFVRQIVSQAQRNNPNAPPRPPLSVKEIETISIYTVVDNDRIQCRQRTATYLVPSQTDPIAFKKWQLSQGKPVDVRYYDVTYTRNI